MTPDRRPVAILFDAGGTLVLQNPAALGERLGCPIDADLAFQAHYQAMAAFARRRMAGRRDSWEWWQERFFTILRVPDPATAGARVDNGYGLWHAPIPGTIETIAELLAMGVRTAVVSNSDGSVRQALAKAGFEGLFEMVVDSHEAGFAKPDPAIFRNTLDLLGLAAADTWYVGDSIFHDMGGAQAAGLARAVLVDPFDLHPEYRDRIPGVTALPALLRDLANP